MSDTGSIGKYEYFGRCLGHCESPIERAFLASLLVLTDYTFEPFDRAPIIARDAHGIELGQQVKLGNYRIDFSLSRAGADTRFAIEIDGYAFHGATPEQFDRDTARQRAVTAKGWTVVRFSGKSIMRDVRRCSAEAMSLAASLVKGPAPTDAAPLKAHIPRSADRRLRELHEQIESAERDGDTATALQLAALARDHMKTVLGAP